MQKEIADLMTKETKALLAAPSACKEIKAAAEAWLAALETEGEGEATLKYVDALEAAIMPIDGLIAFAGSEAGAQVFGAELAKNILAHAEEIKSAGAAYCDCAACAACKTILEHKEEIL